MSSVFVISARKAPVAVVFRRGPSKQVLLLKWNLATDKLQLGQWFKGRIYLIAVRGFIDLLRSQIQTTASFLDGD
jgi:hypothetical protein